MSRISSVVSDKGPSFSLFFSIPSFETPPSTSHFPPKWGNVHQKLVSMRRLSNHLPSAEDTVVDSHKWMVQDNQDNSSSIHGASEAPSSLIKRSMAEGSHLTSTSCPPRPTERKHRGFKALLMNLCLLAIYTKAGHFYFCESLFPSQQNEKNLKGRYKF